MDKILDRITQATDFEVMALVTLAKNPQVWAALIGDPDRAERIAAAAQAEHAKRGL